MKKFAVILFVLCLAANLSAQKGRGQWTENQAWKWQEQVGVIKGFNSFFPAYPGMQYDEIFKKASELGFNCVRLWLDGNTSGEEYKDADKQIEYVRRIASVADKYGIKLSPVLTFQYFFFPQKDLAGAKIYTQKIIGAFAKDKRILLWDIWNEPEIRDNPALYEQMDWISEAVKWCREMSPIQPITSSIIWDGGIRVDSTSKAMNRRYEVEAMMDVHNFHYYIGRTKDIEDIITRVKNISNRPIVCTECMARTVGGTFPRELSVFSKYHIGFMSWGFFISDRNWTVKWHRSAYDPYEPLFHEIFHPDGEPYDWRDLDWVKNFHFAAKGEVVDPGAEFTERWTKDRAWKWMSTGPIKGFSNNGNQNPAQLADYGFNGMRIRCSYGEWNRDKMSFYKNMESLLEAASQSNIRVLPSLLSDDDISVKDSSLADYVVQTIKKFAFDPRIEAWDIYYHPGEKEKDTAKLTHLLRLLFNKARFELPNQPLMATPFLRVKDFEPNFDYKAAMIHGETNGWNYVVCDGGSTPELCNLVWKLSDVISFSSNQKAPELGWIASLAYRYGRPIFCTEWCPPDNEAIQPTLDIFAKNHIYWYCTKDIENKHLLDSFGFKPIITPN